MSDTATFFQVGRKDILNLAQVEYKMNRSSGLPENRPVSANQLFDALNRKYWHGRLPHYRVIRRSVLRGSYLGICNNKTRTILLSKSLSGDRLRLILLHEMCHIGARRGAEHGPMFLRRLRRLVALGEAWLLTGDIMRYDGTAEEKNLRQSKALGRPIGEASVRAVVLGELDRAARDEMTSHRRWPTIRRWLARKYNLSEAGFEHACPWARAEWSRLSKIARHATPCQQPDGAETGGQQILL